MFGVDVFNHGHTFALNAPISDYTDPDDDKYYCIAHPEHEGDGDAESDLLLPGRILWVNGDNNLTDDDGELMNATLNEAAVSLSYGNPFPDLSGYIALIETLHDLGFVKDCTKAKEQQNQSNNNNSNQTNGGDEPICEEGYVLDEDEESDTYGECIEEDNLLLYAGIGVVVVIFGIALFK
jgi:hypothetical protein